MCIDFRLTKMTIVEIVLAISESSRRKFLLMRNFRPLTPPCVPFGTRRFNQLNM